MINASVKIREPLGSLVEETAIFEHFKALKYLTNLAACFDRVVTCPMDPHFPCTDALNIISIELIPDFLE